MKGPSICYGDNGGDGSGGGGGSSGNGNGGGYGGSGSYSDSTFVVGPNGEGWEEYVKKYGAKWEKLSLAEKEFVRNHPYVAICFYKNSQRAISLSQILYPGSQVRSRQDAFRHAYWSALNAYEQGESLARQFGNAHEEEDNQEEDERDRDLYNNNYGYEVGVSARENGYDESWIESEIIWAIDNNILKFLL